MSKYYLDKNKTILQREELCSSMSGDSVLYIERLEDTDFGDLYSINTYNRINLSQKLLLKENRIVDLFEMLKPIVKEIEENV